MPDELTISEWILDQLDKTFIALAEKIADEDILTEGMSPDEIAGIPFMLNAGCLHLRAAWLEFTGE